MPSSRRNFFKARQREYKRRADSVSNARGTRERSSAIDDAIELIRSGVGPLSAVVRSGAPSLKAVLDALDRKDRALRQKIIDERDRDSDAVD